MMKSCTALANLRIPSTRALPEALPEALPVMATKPEAPMRDATRYPPQAIRPRVTSAPVMVAIPPLVDTNPALQVMRPRALARQVHLMMAQAPRASDLASWATRSLALG